MSDKNMNASWKTTLCGVLAIIGGGLTQFFHDVPWVFKLGGFLSTTAPAIGLLFARDNGVTSEQAKARPTSGPGAVGLIVAAAMIGALSLQGCASPYKAAGVVVVAADRAMDGWCDYVVAVKRLPHDAVKLAKQENEVRAAYGRYQSAMEVVYFSRRANQPGQAPDAVAAEAKAAGDALASLVISFLPADRVASLKTQ